MCTFSRPRIPLTGSLPERPGLRCADLTMPFTTGSFCFPKNGAMARSWDRFRVSSPAQMLCLGAVSPGRKGCKSHREELRRAPTSLAATPNPYKGLVLALSPCELPRLPSAQDGRGSWPPANWAVAVFEWLHWETQSRAASAEVSLALLGNSRDCTASS